MANRTVLLVEDNEQLNEINRRALTQEGYAVLTALTLGEARAHLAKTAPDVILLDVLLPDGNGIDFCGEIRDQTDAHIFFLTSKQDQENRIRGLDTGGDDYITKPYKLEQMLSRVRAAMRRRGMDSAKPLEQTITCGALTLDMLTMSACLNGVDLSLSQKEFTLLFALMRVEGKNLSREALYEQVWRQPMAGDGNALWKQISCLNGKLAAHGGTVNVVAIRGEGYRLEFE